METKFKFPVWHKSCDSCESKFECWTDRVVINIDKKEDVYGSIPFEFKRTFWFGLGCFEVKEHWYDRHRKLQLIPREFDGKKIMSLIIEF